MLSIPARHLGGKGDFTGEDLGRAKVDFMDGVVKPAVFDEAVYESTADVTLEYISEYIEELVDSSSIGGNFDIELSQGVLTINCGAFGTFVINKQTPNKQIWLSSPFSGPKRYDWNYDESEWRYRDATMTSLLTEEFEKIFGSHVDFYFLNQKIKNHAHEAYGSGLFHQ